MSRMGSTRLAESQDIVVHLQWYICHHITYGKGHHVVFPVDWPHSSQARSVIGPNVVITNPGYACTECLLAGPFNPEDTETFVTGTKDVVEYLDVADNQIHGNIRQAVCIYPRCHTLKLTYWDSGTCSPDIYIKLWSRQGMDFGDTS